MLLLLLLVHEGSGWRGCGGGGCGVVGIYKRGSWGVGNGRSCLGGGGVVVTVCMALLPYILALSVMSFFLASLSFFLPVFLSVFLSSCFCIFI